jgi:hypothetical protein
MTSKIHGFNDTITDVHFFAIIGGAMFGNILSCYIYILLSNNSVLCYNIYMITMNRTREILKD